MADRFGLYNPATGTFFLRDELAAGPADSTFKFGAGGAGYEALVGDWNGDGQSGVGLFNPTDNTFFLNNELAGGTADAAFRFGPAASGWTPIVGDWDGDGDETIGLYDSATGTFYLKNDNSPGSATSTFRFGSGGENIQALVGDWDGDGVDTIGLYDASTGTFFLKNSNTGGTADDTFRFGAGGESVALVGDWDGDGDDTIGLYNNADGNVFVRNTNSAGTADESFRFGPAGNDWTPLVGTWAAEAAPTFSLTAAATAVAEGSTASWALVLSNADATGTYTVTLAETLNGGATAADFTGDLTVTGTGVSYDSATGVITFAPGAGAATITRAIANDLETPETGEGVTLALSAPTSSVTGETPVVSATAGSASVTITDVPPVAATFELSQSATSVVEGNTVTFTIRVAEGTQVTETTTLTYSVIGDTLSGVATAATAGTDFTPASGTVVFNAGDTEKTVTLNIADDGVVEGLEGLKFSLLNSNLTLIDSKLVSITDGASSGQTFTLTEALAIIAEGGELPEIYSLSDADANFADQTVAGLADSIALANEVIAGATNAAELELNATYTLADTLENLTAADAAVLEGAASYSLTDEALTAANVEGVAVADLAAAQEAAVAAVRENAIVAGATNGAEVPVNNGAYTLADTLENLAAADAAVLEGAASYSLTDEALTAANVEGVAVADLAAAQEAAVAAVRENAIVAGATNGAEVPVNNGAYTLADTLENLAAADAAVLEGAASYSLTDEAGDLGSLTKEQVALVQGATNAADFTYGTIGETFTLTDGADTIPGLIGSNLTTDNSGDDTIVATETTLGSNDVLDGGNGNDLLRYASSGNGPIAEAGFTLSNIETIQITSDATVSTTFDFTGTTGVETVRNQNSSQDLTMTGLAALVDLEMVNVSGGDTNVRFRDSVLTGTSDAVNLLLNDVVDDQETSDATITLGGSGGNIGRGFETVNITTAGSASALVDLVTGAATINVAGDQDLSIDNVLDGATTIDANTFTGDLSVVVDSGAEDVEVIGGTGDDRADFSAGWDLNDSFDGGDGTDTLGLTYGVATAIAAANSGTATNVEILDITDAANANATIDMDNFAGIERVIFNGGINTGITATIDDAVTGLTVEIDVVAAPTGTLVVDLATDGTADELTVALDEIDAVGEIVTGIDVADAETVNISADDDTVAGNGDVTINTLTMTDATTLNLSGDADITIVNTVDPATPILATINAADATGDVTISNTNTAAAGATITLGSGDDVFNVATSNGADTITLGDGEDTIFYSAAAQSSGLNSDTITDFVQGEDVIDVTALGTVGSAFFLGNAVNTTAAETALTSTAGEAVFIQSDNALVVDVNGDGDIGAADLRVNLTGITALTAADLGFGTGVTFTAAVVGFDTSVAADSVENNAVGNEDDTINTTVANSVGAIIDGELGEDTLNVTDTAGNLTIDLDDAATDIENVENITLAAGVDQINLLAADLAANAAGEIASITGVAGNEQTVAFIAQGDTDLTDTTLSEIEIIDHDVLAANDELIIAEHNLADLTEINLSDAANAANLVLEATATDGDFDFTNIAVTFAAAASVLDFSVAEDITVTVDSTDLTNVATISGDATDGVVTTLRINDTTSLATLAVTEIDTFVVTDAVADQTLTVDGDDYTTMAAADTEVMRFTGAGDSNLVFAVGGGAAALSLATTLVTGFDSIDFSAATAGNDVTLDANSIAGNVTIVAAATDDLIITETGDYSNLTITSGDFDSLVITAGETMTVSDTTLDADGTITSMVAIGGSADGAELVVNMVGTTFSLAAVGIGVSGDTDVTITGTAGSDTITFADSKTAGSAMSVTGNGGNDVFRLEDGSGNVFSATNAVLNIADAVRILDFHAGNDQLQLEAAGMVGANATVGVATVNTLNVNTGAGFTFFTDSAVASFASEANVIAAIGNITATDNDEFYVALKNVDGSQVAIYEVELDGAAAGVPIDGGDSITLIAVADVVGGTFGVANIGLY